jgi:hypothetical protein
MDELEKNRRRQRQHEREQREEQEAAEVRAWLERQNYEENFREPVAAARAESVGDDPWREWNQWCDARIEKYIAVRVEQLVERRVAEHVREIRAEMTELAVATRKAIQAMATAIDKHDGVIRELAKRNETDERSSDNPRSLRVVN